MNSNLFDTLYLIVDCLSAATILISVAAKFCKVLKKEVILKYA